MINPRLPGQQGQGHVDPTHDADQQTIRSVEHDNEEATYATCAILQGY